MPSDSPSRCQTCSSNDLLRLVTYKRFWHLCRACGTGMPTQRERYPLRFLPYADLKRQEDLSEDKMYDYFTTEIHIELARIEAMEFHERFMQDKQLELRGKSVLDLSGGNGHFIRWYQEEHGARPTLTEINRKTIDYAREAHDFEGVFKYDLNQDRLREITDRTFDVIMARACIMFAADLEDFVAQMWESLEPGGVLIIDRSTEACLGTLVRVQLDEFSYLLLRRPEVVEAACRRQGFDVIARHDETDPGLYVYDHDLLPHWFWLHYYYEIRNARVLRKERIFNFPARDRRRTTFFLRRPTV